MSSCPASFTILYISTPLCANLVQPYRFVNDNRRVEKSETQKKDSDIKKEFNKNRFVPNRQEKGEKGNRFTNRGTNKDSGMGRDI